MFPEFDNKFKKFNKYDKVNVTGKLPYRPAIDKVYILSKSMEHNAKDGWSWCKGNKSKKLNFGNVRKQSKAYKFKCKSERCQAVKYVDTLIDKNMSRVYYDGLHSCRDSASKHTSSKRKKILKESQGNSDDDFEVSDANVVNTTLTNKSKSPPEILKIQNEIEINHSDIHTVDDVTTYNRDMRVNASEQLVAISDEDSDLEGWNENNNNIDDYTEGCTVNNNNIDEYIAKLEKQNSQFKLMINTKKLKYECLLEEKCKLVKSLTSVRHLSSNLKHEITDLTAMIENENIQNKLLEEKKSFLESKLELLEETNQVEALKSQVGALEAFIKEKESYNCLSEQQLEQVQHTFLMLSEQKRKKICHLISVEAKSKVSRDLFESAVLSRATTNEESSVAFAHNEEDSGCSPSINTNVVSVLLWILFFTETVSNAPLK